MRMINTQVGRSAGAEAADRAADIYNRAGQSYALYADGDPDQLFSFDGLHGYADHCLWSVIEAELAALRATDARSVSVLDIGCGPGTWLRRVVTRARTMGFTKVTARGFDVADAQIRSARLLAQEIATSPGIELIFDVADLADPFAEDDASVDITLCLYSVLSHLPVPSLPAVAAEIARVTKGSLITTVRSVGSMPTVFVDSIEKVRSLHLDHQSDQCKIELNDGRCFTLGFHLFCPAEFRSCFEASFAIEDLCGLDLFHSRFAPDARWNYPSLPVEGRFREHLARLENTYAREPGFIERATHLLLVGHRRAVPTAAT